MPAVVEHVGVVDLTALAASNHPHFVLLLLLFQHTLSCILIRNQMLDFALLFPLKLL